MPYARAARRARWRAGGWRCGRARGRREDNRGAAGRGIGRCHSFAGAALALRHRSGRRPARARHRGRGRPSRRRAQLPESSADAFRHDAQAQRADVRGGAALHHDEPTVLFRPRRLRPRRPVPLLYRPRQHAILRPPHGDARGVPVHAGFARGRGAALRRSERAASCRAAASLRSARCQAHDHVGASRRKPVARPGRAAMLRGDLSDAADGAVEIDQWHRVVGCRQGHRRDGGAGGAGARFAAPSSVLRSSPGG